MTNSWQPIETAPKDGTHVLVINASHGDLALPATVHWFDSRMYGAKSGDAGWHLSVNQMGEYSEYIWGPPTHWMPLPEAPCASNKIAPSAKTKNTASSIPISSVPTR